MSPRSALRPVPALPAPPQRRRLLPGLGLGLGAGAIAVAAGAAVPAASPALVAIVLGTVLANTGVLGPSVRPGLDATATSVLRAGIVLLGLQLALGDVLALGPAVLGVMAAVVALGIGAGLLLGRLLRLPPMLTILISCGFSICGAAAVAATAGTLAAQGSERERLRAHTATAVALVVVVGTAMIPLLPLAAGALGLAPQTAGTWAGASILEVAQVVAAGSLLGPEALDAAVLVKLGRVLLLAPVIAALTLALRSRSAAPGAAEGGARPPLVPVFVIGFLLAVLVRSSGLVPPAVLGAAQLVQSVLLAAAMFALGTGVRWALLRQVGGRPVALALALGVIVTGTGLLGAVLTA
ncbi:membrane protein [Brachybacterium phenoliresistens]|uniref:Membrane protein n=1 Tax=Brachybacterium phenoliresistens TaxID=396014 RepID=Z9JZ48_9MICO|nr:putative sulfate exporter family transporter [Brachybacterium phenoliresistens]EWS83037.1 membrane protein [Brachybacterium phenoliresistens]